MKNKKGFTLIELLAVIVILAIIALIATPIILNMITKARKNAARSSALGYIDAIEYNNGFASIGTEGYTEIKSGDVTEIDVKLKGQKPTSGTITVDNDGKVTKATDLCINGYIVNYDGTDATVGGKCGSNDDEESSVLEETSAETIFKFDPSTGTIQGFKDDLTTIPTSITIPDKIDGVNVTIIGEAAFPNKGLTSVVISDTVETISKYAFVENNITSLSLGKNVKIIDQYAFLNSKFETVILPEKLETLGNYVFEYNSNLSSIIIPSSVTSIGDGIFVGTNLSSITNKTGKSFNWCNMFNASQPTCTFETGTIESRYGYVSHDIIISK